MSMNKIGDTIQINYESYLIVGVWKDGNLEKGLLNLITNCVGMTDVNIKVVINSYMTNS